MSQPSSTTSGNRDGRSSPRLSRTRLSDEAAKYVRELIMSGQLRPSEFVRIDKIADELGISVTPVREGLLALHGEGVLRLEPRRGFMVAELTAADVRDLFWVQAQLEGELVARATKNLTDDELAELDQTQHELAQALEEQRVEDVERLNRHFHRTLNRAGDSPKLSWFLAQSVRYAPSRFYHRIGGWAQSSVNDHWPILEALKARDPEAAREAMRNHIVNAGDLLGRHVDDLPGGNHRTDR
ncbi:GntR family transcriptional regulator [Amycolatopsis palatopharyngis]|uniref:GntR family transcriptional regulator n=1 Tax=Amycolatopsis palatopharyngis TaxID=187982 RepID=UPI000E27280A|nr:GntR family transcriptional regulator [Amycolatopsis palatopharyngis]